MRKTEMITFRCDQDTYNKLLELAKKNEWSISHVVQFVCILHFKREADK